MSRTTWTFGRTSTHTNARWRSLEERVLAEECPPEQVRDARDQQDTDHLPEADLIETAADCDSGHERYEHRNARDHAEREEVRCEKAEGSVGDQLHRGRELEHRGERDHVLAWRQLHRVEERSDHRARDRGRSLHNAADEADDRCEEPGAPCPRLADDALAAR